MKTLARTSALALLGTLLLASSGGAVPPHPDKLVYPKFTYQPPAAREYRTVLKSGPIAYVAEDRELPLVSVTVTLRGGTYLSPGGKEGLAELAGYLLARGGTKTKTAEQLEERLAFLAAQLSSSYGVDRGSVSLNLLTKDLDEGLAILREVLTEPRFQDDKLKLRKDQLLTDMKSRNDDAADIEQRERGFLAFGDGYYQNRYSTKASLEGITREDLVAFHRKWVDPRNMVVAASGDFGKGVTRAQMIGKLDALFARWPTRGEAAPSVPKPAHAMVPGLYFVDKDVNQGRVSVMLPGLQRNDPDYNAALVMNEILGGGDFTSRITSRVRSDEGLAYSAASGLPGGVWFPGTFRAFFQSKARTCAYATRIVLEEMKKIREADVTDEELQTAKSSFIDTLSRNFTTKGETMGVFLDEEFTGRFAEDPEFWRNYAANIAKVTKADVKRVAQRLLANEKVTDVPLRDPLTMKPMAATAR
jgi:predicted Zn-dependent peptidase